MISSTSPAASRAPTAVSSGAEIQRPCSSASWRRSIVAISGSSATPKRSGRSIRRYFPASALAQLSRLGVAEASTTAAPSIEARSTAMSRA